MAITTRQQDGVDLSEHGLETTRSRAWNPTTSMLYTHALERHEGRLAEGGPLAVDTGKYTGRSPKDKFVVREPGSEDRIWWGDVNAEFAEDRYEGLREKVAAHLGERDLYVVDAFAGADPKHRIAVRVVTTTLTTRCSRGRCSSTRPRTSCATSSRRRSSCTRRASRRSRRSTARAPARSSCCTRRAGRS